MWMSGTKHNQQMHDQCISFLEREVKDPVVREKLRPLNEFGCKRVLFLDDWYSMYNEPNVELVTEKPLRITPTGIFSKSPHALIPAQTSGDPPGAYQEKVPGDSLDVETERDVDIIIWGTGFDMDDSGGHFQVYGVSGKNLSQTWKDYPETYWGKSYYTRR